MNSLASSSKKLNKNKLSHYLLEEEVIMNWSTLKKCILMLVLACIIHVAWLGWDSFILLNPQYWQVVNLDIVRIQFVLNSIFLLTLSGLIYPCYVLHDRVWVQRFLPYVAIGIFVISLCQDSYFVGVLSPMTMIAYICLLTVGLVLFKRKIIYIMLILATSFLVFSGYLSFIDVMPYSPLFTINGKLFYNGFWLFSMLYFIAPILVTCLILFEILLSQWRHRERLIQHLSQTDPLTNALNRRSINQSLDELHHDKICPYAVVLLDLDHFKNINDQFGHHMGDNVLIAVSQELQELNDQIQKHDLVGRFGGEEFILILKHSSDLQARQIAERCRAAIEALIILNEHGQAIRVTASFGVALSTNELKPQQLLSQADQALYAAKAGGRNQVKCYPEILPCDIKYCSTYDEKQRIYPS